MSDEEKSKLQEKIKEWQGKLEELELQLSLGEKEAEDFFHEKKDDFLAFVDRTKSKIKDMADIDEGTTTKLHTKFDELKVKFALGRKEAADKLKEEGKAIEDAFDSVGDELKAAGASAGASFKEVTDDISEALDNFKTKVDTYRVQLNLAAADAKDNLNEKKSELQQKVAEVKAKFNQEKGDATEKWDELSGELTEAYSHIKAGLKKFFN